MRSSGCKGRETVSKPNFSSATKRSEETKNKKSKGGKSEPILSQAVILPQLVVHKSHVLQPQPPKLSYVAIPILHGFSPRALPFTLQFLVPKRPEPHTPPLEHDHLDGSFPFPVHHLPLLLAGAVALAIVRRLVVPGDPDVAGARAQGIKQGDCERDVVGRGLPSVLH